jgi:hypothetical protein
MCKKDTDIIYENLSEEEFYEMQGKEYEEDVKKIQDLLNKCSSRLFENKIVVVNNNDDVINNYNKEDFIEKVENLNKEDDFINSHTRVSIKENKDAGIIVIYPINTSNNFGKVNVEIITSLSMFIEKVIYSKKSDNYKTFYRGHGNWEYELVPGIYREQNEHILDNESDYIRNIIASYPKFFTYCKSALDFLSVLQHHAFPTRLLDFSENPLIALYMACSSDRVVHSDTIRIDVPNSNFKYYDSDTVSVLANLAFTENSFSINDFKSNTEEEDELVKSFNKRIDVKKLVHLIRNEKPFFKPEINPEHLENTIVFVKPKQDFDRITHQNGLFALFGIDNSKKEMPKIEFMDPPCNFTHFIIPYNCKKRIMEELSAININEATVYCDMDHIASYYKNISKRNEIENIINKKRADFTSKLKLR